MSKSYPFTYWINQRAPNSAIYQCVPFKCSNLFTTMNIILQENNSARNFDVRTVLIRKYGLLWVRHPGLPWSQSSFTGSWILAFSSSASDCQNLSLAYKNTWTHTFPPPPDRLSVLLYCGFRFPLETFSLALSALLDWKMPQSLKWCLLRLTVYGNQAFLLVWLSQVPPLLWLSPRTIIWSEMFHAVHQCGDPRSEDHERTSWIR